MLVSLIVQTHSLLAPSHSSTLEAVRSLFPSFDSSLLSLHLQINNNSFSSHEAYRVAQTQNSFYIDAASDAGAFYALLDIFNGRKGNFSEQPFYPHRGIMIDASAHFISKAALKRNIDAMALAKLNVLHWRLSDHYSFPLTISDIPEISAAGGFDQSQVYSPADVAQIVSYAAAKQIRVIPQIQSPGHALSWTFSAKYKKIGLTCGDLDPSNTTTWDVAKKVFKQMTTSFSDSFVHLGGKDVNYDCWDLQPSIKTFMSSNNLSSYDQLVAYWRKSAQASFTGKTIIYSKYRNSGVKDDPTAVLQLIGPQASLSSLATGSNLVILSPTDVIQLNDGINPGTNKVTWKQFYNKIDLTAGIDKSRILGFQALIWSDYVNDDVLDNILWPRAVALGDLLWTGEKKTNQALATLLVASKVQMNNLGIYAQPIASEFCELNPTKCF